MALGVTAALIQFKENSTPIINVSQEFTKADTYIPKGHTLVPIEIANYKSLDSIIGKFGVVDLRFGKYTKNDLEPDAAAWI